MGKTPRKRARNTERSAFERRLRAMREQGLKPPIDHHGSILEPEQMVECGWGRLIFANTFDDAHRLAEVLRAEGPERRDIAFYVRDPHVSLAAAPQELFLDPSHTYRLDLAMYRASRRRRTGFIVRRLSTQMDAEALNTIYAARGMVPVPPDFYWTRRDARIISVLIAEDESNGAILGAVTGIDHALAVGDPAHGTSLWCLAVDPQARQSGIGEALVRRLAEQFKMRGAAYLDLSVMHDNSQAISLYEKLGFRRVPYFTLKHKNPINEKLFAGPPLGEKLNPYASIIVDEARRRGIHVEVTDAEGGFFRLTHGGRSVHCREALSELTSAVAMSICDDKAVTRRMVAAAGVRVPEQMEAGADDEAALLAFLERHGQLVVKPARGEQGRAVAVGLDSLETLQAAIEAARQVSDRVLVEECVSGTDLRLIVIDFRVVAAAVRRPAQVVGDGRTPISELIETQSRRRRAATSGESSIPMDAETLRTLQHAGYGPHDIVPAGEHLTVRRTANLHTGGTIHDVTEETHPALIDAAIKAARAIDIPVTGIDLLVRSPREPEYHFIEANERPGLANHEPQPTAERFVDLLFPLSMPQSAREAMRA